MTEIRAESIWAAALSHPLRVRILRQMLHARHAQPVALASEWQTTIDVMHRHFHRLRDLSVIERLDRPGERATYRLRSTSATHEALWRLGAPLPVDINERFATRLSTIVLPHRTALERLRARREQLGLSQPQLARRTGIGVDTLGRIERGQADPRFSQVLVLADELDFPLEQLFTRVGSRHADACL